MSVSSANPILPIWTFISIDYVPWSPLSNAICHLKWPYHSSWEYTALPEHHIPVTLLALCHSCHLIGCSCQVICTSCHVMCHVTLSWRPCTDRVFVISCCYICVNSELFALSPQHSFHEALPCWISKHEKQHLYVDLGKQLQRPTFERPQ